MLNVNVLSISIFLGKLLAESILASFEIKNDDETSLLIDVSDYFLKDSPGFNIINPRLKDNYKIGSVDKKRSSIGEKLFSVTL